MEGSRVAIACQGGGSHAAFTAGVLQGMMQNLPDDVEVVALSGTSGGAICAALAWDGLVRHDPELAVEKLEGYWGSMAARDRWDQLLSQPLMNVMSLRDRTVLPEVSPYHFPPWSEARFRAVLQPYFDFDELHALARRPGAPVLMIGAVEVLSGQFELFTGEELSADCLLASAAIPELLRAVAVPGRGVYGDGLFSHNPPIHQLLDHQIDELWLIQIDSSTCARVPTETDEILERRNALAGNLSIEQELNFIETINQALAQGKLNDPRYRRTRVGRISLDPELGSHSRMDRRPGLLDELRELGKTRCRWFLEQRKSRDSRERARDFESTVATSSGGHS
jgi:NTE family protein